MFKRLLYICTLTAFAFLNGVQADEEQNTDTDSSIENPLFHDEEAGQPAPAFACGKGNRKDEDETQTLACCGRDKDHLNTEPGVFTEELEDESKLQEALAKCKRCRDKNRRIIDRLRNDALVGCERCRDENRNNVKSLDDASTISCHDCDDEEHNVVKERVACHHLACSECK